MKKILIISAVFIIVLVALFLYIRIDFNYGLFKTKQVEWQSKDLKNYSYTYSFGCGEGWGRYRVSVKNKIVTNVTDLNNDGAASQSENSAYSVGSVFRNIEKVYLNNKYKKIYKLIDGCYLSSIDVEYDSTYSYPSQYFMNNKCSPMVADGGGCGYGISDFSIEK